MSTNAMHVAKTGLNAQQSRIQVISNNLANVNTTGFKRDRANFETLLYQTFRPAGAQTSETTNLTAGSEVGTGVRMVNTEKIFQQGPLIQTDNAMDLMIEGDGFFQVLLPDGQIGYTRNGTFGRNAEGFLTTASGYSVQPEILIPEDATDINISQDGIISVTQPGNPEPQEIGQLTLARFVNPRGLTPIGENFSVETQASGPAVVTAPMNEGTGKLIQGALEASNVNVVQELVEMIEAQRAYEVNSKSISATDEMLRFLSNKL
ncbi:flagellar basal-body rod protein FlgG [Thalassovita aquimarina]|uniref:Flagellar basal-body rod protein FlgG n=1 Tax=Thalassovita aquimarina TaxID=2785917 RepID=A0ABS5HM22_9RHOB|nr:flagellar basal-body rod protein FlgG [Thalassovita aquimarina]MBR9649653.1 flagellar basal-body rod protein FlgG [Thalassovita aquimarina]